MALQDGNEKYTYITGRYTLSVVCSSWVLAGTQKQVAYSEYAVDISSGMQSVALGQTLEFSADIAASFRKYIDEPIPGRK